jgi:hypothetical protein
VGAGDEGAAARLGDKSDEDRQSGMAARRFRGERDGGEGSWTVVYIRMYTTIHLLWCRALGRPDESVGDGSLGRTTD